MALVLVLVVVNAGAEIYKWTDSEGRVQFSDRPPVEASAEEVELRPVNTFQGVSIEEVEEVPRSATGKWKSKKVVMYSAPWCGVCRTAKRFFQDKGIPFREMDIEKNRMARNEFDRLCGRGVPLILVGESRMNGFSAASFMKLYKK